MSELFSDDLRAVLEQDEGASSTFIASLCSRAEPPIVAFRQKIEDWYEIGRAHV